MFDMNRIALLLEIIGFCMASVSVAALQINKIKDWADGIKERIHQSFHEISDPKLQQELKQSVEVYSLGKNLLHVGNCVILEPFKVLKDVFEIIRVLLKIRYPWESRKEIIDKSRKIIEDRRKIFGIGLTLFPHAIHQALLQNLLRFIYFSLQILSGKQLMRLR